MSKIYIKNWEPPHDSGIVGSVWVATHREYSPNDEGILNLSNCNKIKFLCYPYSGTSINMYIFINPWNGKYFESEGKWYYSYDLTQQYRSWPPFTIINTFNEWITVEIDWENFDSIPVEVRNKIVTTSLYFEGGGTMGIKLKSLWAETIEEESYGFIL